MAVLSSASPAVLSRNATRAARRGMFRVSDHIVSAKDRRDPVALADARTAMCDYRVALAQSLGRDCDRNGFTVGGAA